MAKGEVKVKILKDTVAGGEFVKAGSEVSVSEEDAKLLIAIGKAEAPGKKKPAKEATEDK